MKQFILGLSIGVTLWGFVACGVPDHWHPTTDIKQVDNNNAGVCQCKEPTNTIVVKEIEVDCSKPVDVGGGVKGVFLSGINIQKLILATIHGTRTDGTGSASTVSLRKSSDGKVSMTCPNAFPTFKLRVLSQ